MTKFKHSSIKEGHVWLLAAILGLLLVNGLFWLRIVPFDGAPDEIHKYEVVYFIWKYGHLPTFGPAADMYIRPAPQTRDGYVYGATATYPSGAYLAATLPMYLVGSKNAQMLLYSARLASLIFVLSTLYLAYYIVNSLFESVTYALVVMIFIALIPQFTYTGAYVNDDAYQIFGVTGVIAVSVRGAKKGWTLNNALLMGLVLAIVSLGKQNGWIAATPFVISAIFFTWFGSWRNKLMLWSSMFLPPVLVLGSWLLRNWMLYQDLLALNVGRLAWQDYINRLGIEWAPLVEQGYGFWDILMKTAWLRSMFESFWGRFFYMNTPMKPGIYRLLLIAVILGSICTAIVISKKMLYPLNSSVKKFAYTSASAFALMFVFAILTSLFNDFQAQGRYFFPLIVPITVFLTIGIHTLGKIYFPKRLEFMWLIILMPLFTLNVYSLIYYIYNHSYPVIPLPNF